MKKRKRAKEQSSQKETGKSKWFQRFEISKEGQTKTENLHRKNSYPGPFSFNEIALKIDNLAVRSKKEVEMEKRIARADLKPGKLKKHQ